MTEVIPLHKAQTETYSPGNINHLSLRRSWEGLLKAQHVSLWESQSVAGADRTAGTEHIRVIKCWKFPHEIANLEAYKTSESQSEML